MALCFHRYFPIPRSLALTAVLAGVALLPAPCSAQFQNPIQAAKDAYNKAKQQAKQQQQQKQQQQPNSTSGQPAQQTTTTASSGIGSQSAAEPWTPPAENAAAAAPVKLDPEKMPEVAGVRLGMTPQQALAALHKQYPSDYFQRNTYVNWPTTPPEEGYDVLPSRDMASYPDVYLRFTPPPGPQVVWGIHRVMRKLHSNRSTVIAALREKYGKETAAFPGSGSTPVTNEAQIVNLVWLYDETGARIPLPPRSLTANQGPEVCGQGGDAMRDVAVDSYLTPPPWCAQHYVGLFVYLGFAGSNEIVDNVFLTMQDIPLIVRTATAATAWLHDYANRQHQLDVERSKSNKPTF